MPLYNDPAETWALAVGRIVLAFGDIEHTACSCLAKVAREPLTRPPARIPLGPRLKKICAALAFERSPAARELWYVAASVADLVEARNLVAHNGISLLGNAHYVSETSEGVTLRFEPTLTSSHDSSFRMTLPELQELAAVTETYAWRFTTAAHATFCELPWVDYEP